MDDVRLPLASNLPEYTVSEISSVVKRTLEDAFGRVRVRGEITELKRHSSGHYYFSLKDEGAKLGAIIWKTQSSRIGMRPENGVEVIATGRLTSYPERSCYQLIVDRMEYAGEGALLVRIELLRKRLAAEGLFDEARKQPLPSLPTIVGVITSERGAVFQDIRTTIARRFPRRILLWPVPVQGEGAAARIAAAIRGFDAQQGPLRPDVMIVARGGGALEDLMVFNEEEVVRAVAACRIPVISAVGHETDTTLIDFAADWRAPTPTAAAEIAVPARADLLDRVQQTVSRLVSAMNRRTQEHRLRLGRAERGLPDLPRLLETSQQRLDDRAERLALGWGNLIAAKRATLGGTARALPSLPALLELSRHRLDTAFRRLIFALPNHLAIRESDLEQRGRLPEPTRLIDGKRAALRLNGVHLHAGLRQSVSSARRRAAEQMPRLSEAVITAALRVAGARLAAAYAHLEALSPEAVLGRGYALIFDSQGHPVTTVGKLRPGMAIRLHLSDGDAHATVDGRAPPVQGKLPF